CVNHAYKTEINDILLTALGLGIKKTFDLNPISIVLEGHGREEIMEDIDINRTVGWFTSMYPVVLDFSFAGNIARQLKEIKETLRRIPNKGIGYGIIKYLTAEENKRDIEFKLNPQLSFNYLGQFDADVKQKSFIEIAGESTGNPIGLNNRRECLIEVNGMIAANRLSMAFTYSAKHFKAETMQRLVANFHSELLNIIGFCCEKKYTEFTPSDFTYKGLSIESIKRLVKEYPGIADLYTLSYMQEGMLFHALADEASYSYFEQMSYRLEGELDICIIERSLNQLFKRHDILRTAFVDKDIERPMQVVLKDRAIDFTYRDIRKVGTYEETVRKIEEFKIIDRKRGFDLSRGVLMRVSILQIDKLEYELIWSFHHILMDGWCFGIINNEFFEIYSSYIEKRMYQLPEVKPYRTYIEWLEKQDKEVSARYWENYLDLFEEQTGVPKTKILLNEENNYRNETVSIVFDMEKTATVNRLAVQEHVTLNTVIQTLWGILLGKYNGKTDVVFGAVVSGRPSQLDGVESMVGLFINTIPVRISFEEKMKFHKLLQQVQKEALAGAPHHYCPLAEIQAGTVLNQNLIDHILIFENYPIVKQIEGYGREKNISTKTSLKLANAELFEQTNYDFNVILEGSEQLRIKYQYNGNVYEGTFVERLAKNFSAIFDQVIANQDLEIRELLPLSEEEKSRLLYEFNATEAKYPEDKNIHEFFAEQVVRTPDHIAVFGRGQILPNTVNNMFIAITYRELDDRSGCLALSLIMKGVLVNNIVAIMVTRSIEMIIVIMGILKSHGAYLPIDPDYPEDRIYYMLKDSAAKLLVTNRSLAKESKKVKRWGGATYYTEKLLRSSHPYTILPSYLQNSSNLAYTIYTSGSTGTPKGVMINHRSVANFMKGVTDIIPFTAKDRILSLTTISFDIFGLETLVPLVRGSLVIMGGREEQLNPEMAGIVIEKESISILQVTPSMLQMIMSLPGAAVNLKILKFLLVGGEAFPAPLLEKVRTFVTGKIFNMYGPTETTIWSTVKEVSEGETLNIGKPITNTTIYILDGAQHLVPIGVPGELYIGGDGLSRGYLNRPELTCEKFVKLPTIEGYCGGAGSVSFKKNPFVVGGIIYRTGDLARWQPNGNLEFFGRLDHQVKIRGFRIELGEIENRLLNHPGVKDALVMAREEANGDKYLCAYIISESELVISELRVYLSMILPEYMIPSYFMQLDKIPLTPNGKLDKKALPDPEINDYPGGKYVPPSSKLEGKLVEIWGEVLTLDKEKISVYGNFFQIGGHSLKATTLISKIHKELKVKVPLTELFKTPTIKALADFIRKEKEFKYSSIEPIEKKEYYPLSSAQKRLYILYRMNEQGKEYNIPFVSRLAGEIQKGMLIDVFQELINRHESLRTSFHMIDNQPAQRIHENVEFDIQYFDFTMGITSDTKEAIDHFIRPFDLSKAPLLRIGLIKESQGQNILMADMHHIVSDGVSMNILLRDFIAVNEGGDLPVLRLQYKDFSDWQNRGREKGVLKDQEAFWLKEFAGEIPVLQLPYDYTRPPIQGYEGNNISFEIDNETAQKLKDLALIEGVTLYMLLLSAFTIFLSKLGNQEDIVVGSPLAGRSHVDLQNIIGMFVNTLAFRNCPAGEKTFKGFLREVKGKTLRAFENQEYQYDNLVEKVVLNRDVSRNPLFDAMLMLQNMDATGIKNQDLNLSTYEYENKIAKFDLTLIGAELKNKLLFAMEYSTQLFKKSTIERFIGYFKKIISAILGDRERDRLLSEIEMLPDEEKRRILLDFNDTNADYPSEKTIHQLFEEQVKKVPDHIALVAREVLEKHEKFSIQPVVEVRPISLSYRQLNEQSNRLAGLLIEKGVLADNIVGIMMERSVEMIIGIMGILKAGGAYLPIDPELPQDRIDFMLKDSSAGILINETEIRNLNFNVHASKGDFCSSNLAYVIYTSGSTGNPKGVMIEHKAVVNFISAMTRIIPFKENDCILSLTTISFDIFGLETLLPLTRGSVVVIGSHEEQIDASAAFRAMEREKVNILQVTPSRLQLLLNDDRTKKSFENLTYLLVGGEAFSGSLLSMVRPMIRGRIFNMYGPTETTIWSTIADLSGEIPLTIGKPIANTVIYILDRYLTPVAIGVMGELYIAGAGVGRGYLNQPEMTSEKFDQDEISKGFYRGAGGAVFSKKAPLVYRTGDIARWLPDGNIEFFGRIDSQVKIRGFRIELGEIENRLLAYEAVKDAVVLIATGPDSENCLNAYIVMDGTFKISELKTFLALKLPHYMIPTYFTQLEKIPLTPSGKVDRKMLEMSKKYEDPDREYVEPATELEQVLATTWAAELKREQIGIDYNFFDIGGNSLNIIIIANKLSTILKKDIQMTTLFQYPTIRSLAQYLNQESSQTGNLMKKEKEERLIKRADDSLLDAVHFFEEIS
ncbi:MAG: hypothetical protein QG657_3882, partial [Acidobacteriota bacterium]|nr:hypothetical protein [Acidobacteriota bacterium]